MTNQGVNIHPTPGGQISAVVDTDACSWPDRYCPGVSLEWEQVVIAARDPVALGRWWCEALGWVTVNEDPVVFEIQRAQDRLPGILFLAVDKPKQGQNRLHVDLRPDDQAVEVERLIAMGATRADVGQGELPWVVLADPEGNEFCVLGAQQASSEE